MAFMSAVTRTILLSLCVLAVSGSPTPCLQTALANGAAIPPIAPFGPLAPFYGLPPGPSEAVYYLPPPAGDILGPLGGDLLPPNPSSVELSIADLVPASAPCGGTVAHVSSFVSPLKVNVVPGTPRCGPGSSMEIVEPLITIETAQCGCTLIRLYWLHEIVTVCPLGTGRWAKTTTLGTAELMHEWVLENTHDVLANPHYHGPPCGQGPHHRPGPHGYQPAPYPLTPAPIPFNPAPLPLGPNPAHFQPGFLSYP